MSTETMQQYVTLMEKSKLSMKIHHFSHSDVIKKETIGHLKGSDIPLILGTRIPSYLDGILSTASRMEH